MRTLCKAGPHGHDLRNAPHITRGGGASAWSWEESIFLIDQMAYRNIDNYDALRQAKTVGVVLVSIVLPRACIHCSAGLWVITSPVFGLGAPPYPNTGPHQISTR